MDLRGSVVLKSLPVLIVVAGVPTETHLQNILSSLSSLFSVITTLSTTFLIALKIVLTTRRSRMRQFYTKIIEILVQSAGLVTFIVLSVISLQLASYLHPFDMDTKFGTVLYEVSIIISRLEGPVIVRLPRRFRNAKHPNIVLYRELDLLSLRFASLNGLLRMRSA